MSKSVDDLKAAFAGELRRNRKYLAFAKKADEEGIFRQRSFLEPLQKLNCFML